MTEANDLALNNLFALARDLAKPYDGSMMENRQKLIALFRLLGLEGFQSECHNMTERLTRMHNDDPVHDDARCERIVEAARQLFCDSSVPANPGPFRSFVPMPESDPEPADSTPEPAPADLVPEPALSDSVREPAPAA